MTRTVGIIGLGNAGKHICMNLHRNGHKVYCLDLNTQLYDGLPADIEPVANAREMAEKTTQFGKLNVARAEHNVIWMDDYFMVFGGNDVYKTEKCSVEKRPTGLSLIIFMHEYS